MKSTQYSKMLIIKLCQARHSTVDPMLLRNIGFQCDVHDKVTGVPRGSEHTLPLTGLVDRAEVAGRGVEGSRQGRLEPYYWYCVKQELGVRLVQLHCLAVPSRTFQEQTL